MIPNYAPAERIETHEWISAPPPSASEARITGTEALPFQPTRTPYERWSRGSLRASLDAPSAEQADLAIDDYIAKHLPPIALDSPSGTLAPFWLKLAIANGLHRNSVWANGADRPKRAQIERCIATALDHDIVFQLDQWPDPDEATTSPLIYFRDHGMLRRLLDMHDNVKRSAITQLIEPDRTYADHKLTEKRRWRDDLSWEGFVIDALRVLTDGEAETFIWRRDPDEIDLVLRWRDGPPWGVEVTRGQGSRKPADGFFEGCRQLGIVERFVVAPVSLQRVRRGVECLDLAEALARTREGLT